MTFTVTFWAGVGALVALATLLGSVCLWVLRAVIHQELEPIRQDLDVLRASVFNHMAHGEKPTEAHVRAALGFPAKLEEAEIRRKLGFGRRRK